MLEISTACGILDAKLKGADYKTDAVHGPAQLREKQYNCLHPFQFKKLDPHVAHGREKVS